MSPLSRTVLLVEDGQDLGPLLRDTLEDWEWRALLVRSGGEAMEVLAREPVGLMLLDYELSDMSAADLLERLRSRKTPIPPTVLISARDRSGFHEKWPELLDVLRKPFELDELSALLERLGPRTT